MNMNNEMTPFCFGDNLVRVVKDSENNPWFIGKDVALALGYERPADAISAHCKYPRILKVGEIPTLNIPPRGLSIIPESDLFRLIMKSKLDSAEIFQDWVVEEILPTIRKTGTYQISGTDDSPENMKKSKNLYFAVARLVEGADKYLGGVAALRALNYFTGMPVDDLVAQVTDKQSRPDLNAQTKAELTVEQFFREC